MACYHPLKAYPIGKNLETGKTKYAISKLLPGDNTEGYTIIPCGQCIGCRIDYSRQWADRCMLEAKEHDSNYFLTLTYDDDHLDSIRSGYTEKESGEYKEILSLNKRDLQLFHKRLRKKLDADQRPPIRFFACGEYGSPENTMRPHFHEICFGLVLDDLKLYKYNKLKQPLYTSEYLNQIWKKGFVIIGQATWESCAYVARYVMKKIKGEGSELYREYNITPPFTVMSRKPGIGRKYYEDHPELFDYSYFNLAAEDGSRKIYPPRYFKSLLEIDDPEKFEKLKENNRLSADLKTDAKLSKTDLVLSDQLVLEESSFNDRIRILGRKEL